MTPLNQKTPSKMTPLNNQMVSIMTLIHRIKLLENGINSDASLKIYHG